MSHWSLVQTWSTWLTEQQKWGLSGLCHGGCRGTAGRVGCSVSGGRSSAVQSGSSVTLISSAYMEHLAYEATQTGVMWPLCHGGCFCQGTAGRVGCGVGGGRSSAVQSGSSVTLIFSAYMEHLAYEVTQTGVMWPLCHGGCFCQGTAGLVGVRWGGGARRGRRGRTEALHREMC